MADSALHFLLENLKQVAIYQSNSRVLQQVEQLTDDLNYFDSFLKYASEKKLKDERILGQVKEAIYGAEDVLELYATQLAMASKSSMNWFPRIFTKSFKLDDEIVKKVRKVSSDVKGIYGGKNTLDVRLLQIHDEGPDEEHLELLHIRRDNVVGLEDEAKKVIGCLLEETEQLDIISIVGMPGLGKSTLAGKIFQDPMIQYEFPTRLWVDVSKFHPKDVFLSILKEFTIITEEMHRMTTMKLAARVSGYLERGKFLIVMDDVWTQEDWKIVSSVLPSSNHMGKILITTRYNHVAEYVNPRRKPHKLRFLSDDEIWQLLQYEVFGELNRGSEFEIYGKNISSECQGHPLSTLVIAGILQRKFAATEDINARLQIWKVVSERFNDYLIHDHHGTMEKTFSVSYHKLPHELRACFLYLAMFPEDIEIPTWKLFQLWIAEGFIEERTNFTKEEVAEHNLDELIARNLVIVGTRSHGGVKTCRIHSAVRIFCAMEAGKHAETIFQEIKTSSDGGFDPPIHDITNYRRLCIHSNISNFLSSKPSGSYVRSFVCFSKEDITLDAENAATIPRGFKLLRVLDVKPLKFTKIPSNMYDMILLRYIHLSINMSVLPEAFAKLWNVQTLLVDTTQNTIEIKADIWKMRHLRHLKTNATATLPKPSGADLLGENNIQTLGPIPPENCTDKIFNTARNLKRVCIRGQLAMLLKGESTGGSFENIRKLVRLEKLKLQNDAFPLPRGEAPLPSLPPSENFPPNLRILTLGDTFLEWSEMEVLASLKNLEVLKLKGNAFSGNHWETHDGGFHRLRVLSIVRTDLNLWKASAHHFPRLTNLELLYCYELREVPIDFANIRSLKVLDLKYCPAAVASAKKIQEQKMLQSEDDKTVEFKMSIFPPVN